MKKIIENEVSERSLELEKGFESVNNQLHFHGIDLLNIIKKHGSPLKISYLPLIKDNILNMKNHFRNAFEKFGYQGDYHYAYCTKASHFEFVMDEVLKHNVHLEISSLFDIDIVNCLINKGRINGEQYIICNGYKDLKYRKAISKFINQGYKKCVPIIDSLDEYVGYENQIDGCYDFGIRITTYDKKDMLSRFGLSHDEALKFVSGINESKNKGKLKFLHFSVGYGMELEETFLDELESIVELYCDLASVNENLSFLDIGGGLSIESRFDEDSHEELIEEVVTRIKKVCDSRSTKVPDIFTEFGNYTVANSGAVIYSVKEKKKKGKNSFWYLVNGSLANVLPDYFAYGASAHIIDVLPINLHNKKLVTASLGGKTCDVADCYPCMQPNTEEQLPTLDDEEQLHIGFFNTGTYQESIGGYGGIQHCLIPAPKHVLFHQNCDGDLISRVFAEEQKSQSMMNILGYSLESS